MFSVAARTLAECVVGDEVSIIKIHSLIDCLKTILLKL